MSQPASPTPRSEYPMHGAYRALIFVLGVITIPIFGLGLLAIKISFQKLIFTPQELHIKTLWTKRIPYADIYGVRRLPRAEAEGRSDILGIYLRGRKGPYFIPITKFQAGDEFARTLAACAGVQLGVNPDAAPAHAYPAQGHPAPAAWQPPHA